MISRERNHKNKFSSPVADMSSGYENWDEEGAPHLVVIRERQRVLEVNMREMADEHKALEHVIHHYKRRRTVPCTPPPISGYQKGVNRYKRRYKHMLEEKREEEEDCKPNYQDVCTVMRQCDVDEKAAFDALVNAKGNMVDAIMDLSEQEKSDEKEPLLSTAETVDDKNEQWTNAAIEEYLSESLPPSPPRVRRLHNKIGSIIKRKK